MSFISGRRDLTLVASAKAISWFGDEAAMTALTLRLQGDGHGAIAVAALLVANLMPILLLSGVVGRIVDRHDNRRLLVLSGATQLVLCTALAFVSAPAAVLVLVCGLGAGQAVNGATWSALLPTIAGDDLPKAMGVVQAAMTSAGIAAPALAGLLTGLYGARVPLLVDAATFGFVACAAWAVRARRVVVEAPGRARGSLAIVRSDSLLRPLFALFALFVLLGSMVNVVDVFLVRVSLDASATWYGVVGAAYSAGALAGAVASGRLSTRRTLARGLVLSSALLSLGLVGHGLAPSVLWLLPIALATGAANGVLNVTVGSLVMGAAAQDERGRVGALLAGVASGTQLAAFGVAGALAGLLDPRAIFVLAGALGVLAPLTLGHRLMRAAGTADSTDMSTEPVNA